MIFNIYPQSRRYTLHIYRTKELHTRSPNTMNEKFLAISFASFASLVFFRRNVYESFKLNARFGR